MLDATRGEKLFIQSTYLENIHLLKLTNENQNKIIS